MAEYKLLKVSIKDAWTSITVNKEDKNKFNEEFMKFVPALRHYILSRIRFSVSTGKLPENKYKVDDFLDELFISAYENIQHYDSPEDYYVWLIQTLDGLLEDISIEEEFNEFFFKNIENYTHEEWEAMEEEYTKGADGQYILTEELDDASYDKHQYTLRDVFIDDSSEALINKISDKLNAEQIKRHIELMINKLPVDQQIVFQQAVLLGSNLSQIAKVRTEDAKKIENSLNVARLTIQQSFVARFDL